MFKHRCSAGMVQSALALSLIGCATATPPPNVPPATSAPPPRVASVAAPSRSARYAPMPVAVQRPNPEVYSYPTQGQSPQQQDRDRYECYLWARKQTGYDPSLVRVNPRSNLRVSPAPPAGRDTAVGTVAGAVVGSTVVRPRDATAGAVIGAVAGAVIGAASDSSRVQRAKDEQARLDAEQAQRAADADAGVLSYQRALRACLQGRGYSVE